MQAQYPIKPEVCKDVQAILAQLLYQGIIEPCNSSMNSCFFPLSEPDGTYRITLDYRNLNSHTRTYAVQNAHSTGLMTNLVQKKYRSTLDIANGYFSENIVPESVI